MIFFNNFLKLYVQLQRYFKYRVFKGSVKRKLPVIGKSKNPHCFKNIRPLPINYKANKSAWMTYQIC